jgi:putative ABC transport system permease protein
MSHFLARPSRKWCRGISTIVRLVNLRHVWEHPRRTLLTLAGLSASVCLLITIGVINSTLNGSIEAETRGLAGDATVEVAPAGTGGLNPFALPSVRRAPGVRSSVPFVQELSRMRHDQRDARAVIFGLPANIVSLFPGGLGDTARELASAGFQAGGLILTRRLAQSLGVRPGETVAVETSGGYLRLRVSALLAQGPFSSVNGGQFALMTLAKAQAIFHRAHRLDGIYVTANSGWSAPALTASLQRRLQQGAIVEPPGGGARAYQRTFDSIASISQEARIVGLVVALFLVLNTMSMALAERREEITLLITGGASREQVMGAFLAEAALLGLLGGILGIIGGAALAHVLLQRAVDSYNILPITAAGPLVVRPIDVLLGLAGGLAVAVAGASIPALRILRAAPIDALRPEAAYEWGARRTPRLPRSLLLLGVGAIGLSALLAWLAPLGSSVLLVGLALAVALAGAILVLPWLIPVLTGGVRRLLPRPFGPVGRLAANALIKTPGRTTIAAGGLAMAASFVLAVGTSVGSYRTETERAARAWYGAPLYVSAQGSAAYVSDQPLPVSLAQRLVGVPGVAAAYPMRFGLVDNRGHQVVIYALPVAEAARAGHRIIGSLGISERQLVGVLGHGEVVISRLTARRHHVSVGDKITLPSSFGDLQLRIGGFFDDIASFDSVFLEHLLYERLARDATADRFAIVAKPATSIVAVKRRLQRFVEVSGIPASVFTREQMASYLVNSIQSLFSIAQGIEIAALLVAVLIVMSTMLTATFERRREFAIQRILGMSRRQLAGSVVLEAIAISAVGAIVAVGIGLGLGFLMTLSIENQLAWRVSFSPSLPLTLGTALAIVVLGALAALYPSLLATRQTIIRLLGDDE